MPDGQQGGIKQGMPPEFDDLDEHKMVTDIEYVDATLTKGGDLIPHMPTAHIWRRQFGIMEEEPKLSYYQKAKKRVGKLAALTKGKGKAKDGEDPDGADTPKSPKLGGGAGDSTKKFDAVTIQLELAALLPPRFVMRPNPEKVKAGLIREKKKKKIRKEYASGNTDHAKARAAKVKARAEAKAKREKKLAKMKAKIAKEKKKTRGVDYDGIAKAVQVRVRNVTSQIKISSTLYKLRSIIKNFKNFSELYGF